MIASNTDLGPHTRHTNQPDPPPIDEALANEIIGDYFETVLDLVTIAGNHGLTLTQLITFLRSPTAQQLIADLTELSEQRAQAIATQGAAVAALRLKKIASEPLPDPHVQTPLAARARETARKAAAQILKPTPNRPQRNPRREPEGLPPNAAGKRQQTPVPNVPPTSALRSRCSLPPASKAQLNGFTPTRPHTPPSRTRRHQGGRPTRTATLPPPPPSPPSPSLPLPHLPSPMSGLFTGTPLERPVTCEHCGRPLDQCTCPRDPAGRVIRPEDQHPRVRREKRRGKWCTVVADLNPHTDLKAMLKNLRTALGTGGGIANDTLIIQGDHRDAIVKRLQDMGYKAKAAGG